MADLSVHRRKSVHVGLWGTVISLGLLTGVLFQWTKHLRAPHLVVQGAERRTVDAFVDQPFVQEFGLCNRGGGPLHVRVARKSCDCANAELSESEILPGEQGTLRIAAFAPSQEGAFSVSVELDTNDPENKTRVFQISGNADRLVSLSPSAANFGSVKASELPVSLKLSMRLSRTTYGDVPIRPKAISNYEYLLPRVVNQSQDYVVEIMLDRGAPCGILGKEVVLELPPIAEYRITVPVFLHVSGSYEVSPLEIWFKPDTGKPQTEYVSIEGLGTGEDVDVTMGDPDMQDKFDIRPVRIASKCLVGISLIPSIGFTTKPTALVVRVHDARQKQLEYYEIPVYVSPMPATLLKTG